MPYITRQDDISALPLSVRSQNCLRRLAAKNSCFGYFETVILDQDIENSAKQIKMLDAIDNHTLEAMPTSDEDLAKIFEKLF